MFSLHISFVGEKYGTKVSKLFVMLISQEFHQCFQEANTLFKKFAGSLLVRNPETLQFQFLNSPSVKWNYRIRIVLMYILFVLTSCKLFLGSNNKISASQSLQNVSEDSIKITAHLMLATVMLFVAQTYKARYYSATEYINFLNGISHFERLISQGIYIFSLQLFLLLKIAAKHFSLYQV